MKNLVLIIVVILSLGLSGCSVSISGEKNLENEKWIEDINYLDENLRKKHPDLFRYISEKEWNIEISDLKEDVKYLSDQDIALNMAHLVSLIQDGHTNIDFLDLLTPIEKGGKDIDEVIAFPIRCAYFEDGLRVVMCDSEYKETLGYKLISINGVQTNEVIQKLSSLVFYDNTQSAKESARNYMNIYEFLKFLDIVNNEEAKYVFEDNEKNKITLNIKAKKYKEIDFLQLEHKVAKTSQTPEGESDFYWFKDFKEDEILYFKYNKCRSEEGYYTKNGNKYYHNSYFEFEKMLIDKINNTKFNKLIIDLRDNPGGRTIFADSLVSGLKNNTDLKGEDIVVISGKRTSSAGVILTWKLQKEIGATVVGEETGGNVNIFGFDFYEARIIALPNSNLVINHASTTIENEKDYENGVKPDIEIIQNYYDYLNGVDSCYEYIKNMVKQDL